MPLAIVLGLSSVLGAGASIFGASTEANASEQAAQLQYQMFQQEQANEKPFVGAGSNAIQELMAGLTGPNGYGSLDAPFNPSNLAQTPGYQFALNQGEQAITDTATATGGVGGGNTLKALTQYGQGLASTTYQQQLQDYMAQQGQAISALGGVAQLGEAAGSNSATGASAFGGQIGNDITGAGSAIAAGATGVTNSLQGGASNYLLASLLNSGGGAGASYNFLSPGG